MRRAAKALVRDGQGKILVLYRSETHPHLAHDVDLPGGIIDEGETLEDGLTREILEETGLRVKVTIDDMRHSWLSSYGQEQFLYEAIVSDDQQVEISWEHSSYRWVDDRELVEHPAIDSFIHHVQAWLS